LNIAAGWQSGHAAACKAVDAGSIPTPASNTINPLERISQYRFGFLGESTGESAAAFGKRVRRRPQREADPFRDAPS
jgi:hypothetical protein